MEYIKIDEKRYLVKDISRVNANLIKIEYENEIPSESTSVIDIFTSGGELCGRLVDYETIYKKAEKSVIYSNDGSVYTEPVEQPDPEPVELTEEEKAAIEKLNEIRELETEIAAIDNRFHELDYIGIKIATGRAQISDYESEIEEMTQLADKKNELEEQLRILKEES